jgi:hypothetical protein
MVSSIRYALFDLKYKLTIPFCIPSDSDIIHLDVAVVISAILVCCGRTTEHFVRAGGETVTPIRYGIDVVSKNDLYISMGEEIIAEVGEAAMAGAFLVDRKSIVVRLNSVESETPASYPKKSSSSGASVASLATT